MNLAIESPSSGAILLIHILQLRQKETTVFKRDWQAMVPINPSWTTVCGFFSLASLLRQELALKFILVLGFLGDAHVLFLTQKPSHPVANFNHI